MLRFLPGLVQSGKCALHMQNGRQVTFCPRETPLLTRSSRDQDSPGVQCNRWLRVRSATLPPVQFFKARPSLTTSTPGYLSVLLAKVSGGLDTEATSSATAHVTQALMEVWSRRHPKESWLAEGELRVCVLVHVNDRALYSRDPMLA